MFESKVMFTKSGFNQFMKYSKRLVGSQKSEFHKKINVQRETFGIPLTSRLVAEVYVNKLSFGVAI